MGDYPRWQVTQVYSGMSAPGSPPEHVMLLDTETGEIWELDQQQSTWLDQQQSTWKQMPRQATNQTVAAGVWRHAQLEKLLERSVMLLREVVRGYNWAQQDIDQLEADVRAAGVIVP